MGVLQEVELLTGEEGESLESKERESRQEVGWCEWQSQAPPPSSSHWPTSVPVRPPAIQKSSSGPQREGSDCPPTPFWALDAELPRTFTSVCPQPIHQLKYLHGTNSQADPESRQGCGIYT